MLLVLALTQKPVMGAGPIVPKFLPWIAAGTAAPTSDSFIVSPGQSPAMQFRPEKVGATWAVRLVIHNAGSIGVTPFQVAICKDVNGSVGARLGTWSGATDGQPYWSSTSTTEVPTPNLMLSADTPYWLVLITDGSLAWIQSSSPDSPVSLPDGVTALPPAYFQVLVQ